MYHDQPTFNMQWNMVDTYIDEINDDFISSVLCSVLYIKTFNIF